MEVVNSVIGKIVDCLFSEAIQEINHARNCEENVEKLKKEVEMLKDMMGRVQQRIVRAKGKGDDLIEGVETWMGKARNEILEAEEFLKQEENSVKSCFNLRLLCFCLSTLSQCSQTATKKAVSLKEHREAGKDFQSCVSIPTSAPRDIDLYERKNYDQIHSHKLLLNKIVASIKDESIQIVGIYGVGGVGKTTIAKEVAAQMKEFFADVVIITVSQDVQHEQIREKIKVASMRIEKGEKVLVVLDDLWKELPLDEVGIPCGSNYKNCKILLTSRRENVCVAMNTQKTICVESLTEDEAWILFKNVVGEKVETYEFNKTAKEIKEECGGLPLFIQVVGNALKNKSIELWKAALAQLRNHVARNLTPEVNKAFNQLKLSYNYLDCEEARSCFLLCSMFPEDLNIELENLVQYGIGLEKFDDLQSIEDARNRVQIAVNTLKSSCLLLDGDRKGTTKMHDVVRDMALLIAPEGDKKTVVEAGKGLSQWHPRNAAESYIGISLMQNKICELPDHEFDFPHLDSFLILNNELESIPDKFLRAIKNVKVLDIGYNNISSLPQSFNLLTKLCMLNLSGNRDFNEISILGVLKNLQILILDYTNIEEIPQEIGQLTKLRCLSAKHCYELSRIAPGVISKLCRLEELCVGFFKRGDRSSLEEIPNLPFLTKLELAVTDFDGIPKNFEFGKLQYFAILVGTQRQSFDHTMFLIYKSENKRFLILEGIDNPFMTPYSKLIKAAEEIHMNYIIDDEISENILTVMFSEGIDEVKEIAINTCYAYRLVDEKAKGKFFSKVKNFKLECMLDIEVLWKCPDEYISFHNLEKFEIGKCWRLKRLFPVSVAKGLVNLRSLILYDCNSLESVICDGYEEAGNNEIEMIAHEVDFEFRHLTCIWIRSLALKSFCNGHSTIKYPSLEMVHIEDCPDMKTWGHGIHDMPKMDFRHQGTSYNINDYVLIRHEEKKSTIFSNTKLPEFF